MTGVQTCALPIYCDYNYCNKFPAPFPIALQNKFGAIDQSKDKKWFKDNCVEGEDGSLLKEEPRQVSADETREYEGWNNSICSLTPCLDPESKNYKYRHRAKPPEQWSSHCKNFLGTAGSTTIIWCRIEKGGWTTLNQPTPDICTIGMRGCEAGMKIKNFEVVVPEISDHFRHEKVG